MVMTSLSGHLLNMEFGLQYRKWLVGQDRTERDGTGRDGLLAFASANPTLNFHPNETCFCQPKLPTTLFSLQHPLNLST